MRVIRIKELEETNWHKKILAIEWTRVRTSCPQGGRRSPMDLLFINVGLKRLFSPHGVCVLLLDAPLVTGRHLLFFPL